MSMSEKMGFWSSGKITMSYFRCRIDIFNSGLVNSGCESVIASNFEEGTAGWNFAYREFFESLEITVEELAKCFFA